MQTIIADPEFLFRFERTPAGVAPGANYRISDLELASRLSYFLWSSAPDDELITRGEPRQAQGPAGARSSRCAACWPIRNRRRCRRFSRREWLNLQNLQDVQPDAFLFPNFDRNLARFHAP